MMMMWGGQTRRREVLDLRVQYIRGRIVLTNGGTEGLMEATQGFMYLFSGTGVCWPAHGRNWRWAYVSLFRSGVESLIVT
jgi:hypothetical protein